MMEWTIGLSRTSENLVMFPCLFTVPVHTYVRYFSNYEIPSVRCLRRVFNFLRTPVCAETTISAHYSYYF